MMMQLIIAAIAKGGFNITLTNQNQTKVGAGSGTPQVGIQLKNTGEKHIISSDGPNWGSAIDAPEEWVKTQLESLSTSLQKSLFDGTVPAENNL